MINIIQNNSELEKVISQGGINLIDLYADWCSPCKQLLPIIEELSNENNEVNFFKYNVESDSPDFLKSLSVRNIPTVLVYKDGVEAFRFSGYKDKRFITQELNNLTTNERGEKRI